MSRSPTKVITYFMRKNSWRYLESLKYVRDRRNLVDPNFGFKKRLKEYEIILKKRGVYNEKKDI